ncbi:MAG TPA: sensor histidine kinase [Candidatus Limnocylindria bacterium]|nr:sensor histidine kinase [Candidatus Limnocylindria bacterium]
MGRFNRIGIQTRIMVYVTVGLAVMFGGFAYLGFRAVGDATELVYDERLSTAYTTAATVERDFAHVAKDIDEALAPIDLRTPGEPAAASLRVLTHLAATDPFTFFRITGIWILTAAGDAVTVGEPAIVAREQILMVRSAANELRGAPYHVIPAVGRPSTGTAFGTIVVPVGGSASLPSMLVAIHATSVNSLADYTPLAASRADASTPVAQRGPGTYHLEVLDPYGMAVLGIGADERPGEVSRHMPVVGDIMAKRDAAVIMHEPARGQSFPAHAMAVVPLGASRFYLILEQPRDVALSLPIDLGRSVGFASVLGFLAALLVAWVTTRHVTRPTEELTVAAQRMARGDLESPIRVRAQDEVGRLAENLDAMRRQLRDAYRQISEANERLEGQVAERTARLSVVLGKVISAQEEERRRLARELHDETAQTMGALAIALDRARHGMGDASPDAIAQLQEAQTIVKRLLEDTRRLILDLRPMALEDLGLVPAIRWYAESHLQDKGVGTTIELDRPAVRLAPHLEVALFRIAQEAINNIARHADAASATIHLDFSDAAVRIAVADDGHGFDVDRALASSDSVGLIGLQERARLLSGRMDINSQAGRGTQVTVELPIVLAAAQAP